MTAVRSAAPGRAAGIFEPAANLVVGIARRIGVIHQITFDIGLRALLLMIQHFRGEDGQPVSRLFKITLVGTLNLYPAPESPQDQPPE